MGQNPAGIHLCGFVPFESAQEVFQQLGTKLGNRLTSIPDGETDTGRHWWIFCQTSFVQGKNIELIHPWFASFLAAQAGATDSASNEKHEVKRKETHEYEAMLTDFEPGYDIWAKESYEKFRAAKEAGFIPKHVKFQVCLPTPLGVVTAFANRIHAKALEEIYARKLKSCVQQIQATIPHDELAIQWDYAMEPAILDEVYDYLQFKDFFAPHFEENIKEELMKRMEELMRWVEPEVDMGFHLCYGDLMHTHFKQPEDTALLVEFIEMILTPLIHRINWIHIPVPKERSDIDYLKPLTQNQLLQRLSDQEVRLSIGLVHANDEAGTQAKIAAAKEVLSEAPNLKWSIATECGWGRTPKDEIASIIEILEKMSLPVV